MNTQRVHPTYMPNTISPTNSLGCSQSGTDTGLVSSLRQLRHLLTDRQPLSAERHSEHLEPVPELDICQLLDQHVASTAELCQRLERVETHNHELRLQLSARLSESQTDGLTGLANRRTFDQEFLKKCQLSQQTQSPVMLVMLDIDHFKSVNDQFGHSTGDAVLVSVARILQGCMPLEALLARYGGEEFAMILTCTSIDDAIEIVENMRQQICSTRFCHAGVPLAITISCGIATLATDEHNEHLLERADEAMYAAKQAGRNRTFWHARQQLNLVSNDGVSQVHETGRLTPSIRSIDLDSIRSAATTNQLERQSSNSNVASLRTTRASWCDASMLFWSIRQRLAEWKRGGEAFCLLAIEIDNGPLIAQTFGSTALQFLLRAQLLHLDAALRDMDVVARTGQSRVVALLPRTDLAGLTPILQRLHHSMDRFAFPTAGELVEYSISTGVTFTEPNDDPKGLMQRAEKALKTAQKNGHGLVFAADAQHAWEIAFE